MNLMHLGNVVRHKGPCKYAVSPMTTSSVLDGAKEPIVNGVPSAWLK